MGRNGRHGTRSIFGKHLRRRLRKGHHKRQRHSMHRHVAAWDSDCSSYDDDDPDAWRRADEEWFYTMRRERRSDSSDELAMSEEGRVQTTPVFCWEDMAPHQQEALLSFLRAGSMNAASMRRAAADAARDAAHQTQFSFSFPK